jgi:hypothetical protein
MDVRSMPYRRPFRNLDAVALERARVATFVLAYA